jgi:hypothetical protein
MTDADEGAAKATRAFVLEGNRANVQNALRYAASNGLNLSDVVVVIADAREVLGDQHINSAVFAHQRAEAEMSSRLGEMPTLTTCKPRSEVIAAFRTVAPSVARQLELDPPDGQFWLCVVASAGVTIFARPLVEFEGTVGSA